MAATYRMPPPPPMGRAGTAFPTTSGTWAWNGGTQQWTVLPSGTSQVYGWDGTSQSWVPVTGGGGTGMGVTDGSNAAPGQVGEYITVTDWSGAGPANSTVVNQVYNLITMSLTAGDWDVQGALSVNGAGNLQGGITTNAGLTYATLPWPRTIYASAAVGGIAETAPLIGARLNLTVTTPVYLYGVVDVAGLWMGGALWARRMR